MQNVNHTFVDNLDRRPASLKMAADDWGHAVHHLPLGVVRPTNSAELVATVQQAAAAGLTIAARGRGHSTLGQAQAPNGVVIDMRQLNRVLEIGTDAAWVEAGATWRELLQATLAQGLTPPTFTDYIDLTIGGTLSVGGIGSQTYRAGLQCDNVLALEVITGTGQVQTCSSTENADLFYAVLAGLGQVGIILKAQIVLEPARPMARYVRTLYADFDRFLEDMFTLVQTQRYDGIQGFVVPNDPAGLAQATGNAFPNLSLPVDDNRWLYMIEGAAYYTPGSEPPLDELLCGLGGLPDAVNVLDLPYAAYIARLDIVEAALREAGLWDMPHPWIDVFVPRDRASEFVQAELDLLEPEGVGGPILVYPYLRSAIKTPNFPLPDSEQLVLFALLRTALPPTPERVEQLLAANRAIYKHCLSVGGTGYAIDAVPLTPDAWQRHFGTRWSELAIAKQHYDPAHLLAPSQNVFV